LVIFFAAALLGAIPIALLRTPAMIGSSSSDEEESLLCDGPAPFISMFGFLGGTLGLDVDAERFIAKNGCTLSLILCLSKNS
jgi:hypothetical protein